MSPLLFSLKRHFAALMALSASFTCVADPGINSVGGEKVLGEKRVGDQVHPQLAFRNNAGFLVWEENGTARTGSLIRFAKVNAALEVDPASLRQVNLNTRADMLTPQVAALANGGAVVAWQAKSARPGDIYLRFIKSNGTFQTGDLLVNYVVTDEQLNPSLTVLTNGNVVVAFSSFGEDKDRFGVFARIFTPAGRPVGRNIQLNQVFTGNQRNPSLAALNNGQMVAVWVSEGQRWTDGSPDDYSVAIYGRVFNADGKPAGSEFLVNTSNNVAGSPAVTALSEGGFAVAWNEKDGQSVSSSLDVYARSFGANGTAQSAVQRLNRYTYGDQFNPQITASAKGYMVVWTSLKQDGNFEGVYGRFIASGKEAQAGDTDEIRINTTTISRQMHPAVARNGESQFVVGWTSFGRGLGFDLFARSFSVTEQQ